MFVLHISTGGKTTEVRWTAAEAVLGSGDGAGIRRDDVGWAEREAVFSQQGLEVLLARADGSKPLHLRVGDAVKLGDAEVSLTGLLPLEAPPASALAFGGYEEEPVHAGGFTLADEDLKPRREVQLTLPRERFGAEGPLPALAGAATAGGASAPAAAATEAEPEKPKSAWKNPSFDHELVATLKRAPWFALSAAIHASVALVLYFFLPGMPVQRDLGYGVENARLEAKNIESGGPVDNARPEESPHEETAIEPPADPLEPTLPDEEADHPKSTMAPPAEMQDPEDSVAPESLIGTSLSIVSMKVKRSGKVPSAPVAVAGADVVNEDTERAPDQNRKAAAAVRDQIQRAGGALGRALKGLHKEDILVVSGSFDHMESVLSELEIPYTLKSPYDVNEAYPFSHHKFVFWNCGEPFPPRFKPGIIGGIREFVRAGGYLFTSDWMVQHILVPAFPGYLATPGGSSPLPDLILEVRPREAARNHPLLDGVFLPGAKAKWWLESSSFEVVVRRTADVEVLIESPTLAEKPWNRSSALAVTFAFGRGRVLHTMGHYWQQKGNVAGTMGAQRLPLNFIRMRMERDAPADAASDK